MFVLEKIKMTKELFVQMKIKLLLNVYMVKIKIRAKKNAHGNRTAKDTLFLLEALVRDMHSNNVIY